MTLRKTKFCTKKVFFIFLYRSDTLVSFMYRINFRSEEVLSNHLSSKMPSEEWCIGLRDIINAKSYKLGGILSTNSDYTKPRSDYLYFVIHTFNCQTLQKNQYLIPLLIWTKFMFRINVGCRRARLSESRRPQRWVAMKEPVRKVVMPLSLTSSVFARTASSRLVCSHICS